MCASRVNLTLLPETTVPLCRSRACEAGVEHPDLESALWASTTSAVKALEHVAKNVDYRTLCEGLARLTRVVGALLREAASSDGGQSQTERQAERQVE